MIWVELQCDYVTKGDTDCYSHVGDAPWLQVKFASHVSGAIARMMRGAVAAGWRRNKRTGLICPACVKHIRKTVQQRVRRTKS